jgi:hypothetical protein
MFLNKTLSRSAFNAKIELEAAVAQRRVDEGKKELDGKRSMIRHISHEIRYGLAPYNEPQTTAVSHFLIWPSRPDRSLTNSCFIHQFPHLSNSCSLLDY